MKNMKNKKGQIFSLNFSLIKTIVTIIIILIVLIGIGALVMSKTNIFPSLFT